MLSQWKRRTFAHTIFQLRARRCALNFTALLRSPSSHIYVNFVKFIAWTQMLLLQTSGAPCTAPPCGRPIKQQVFCTHFAHFNRGQIFKSRWAKMAQDRNWPPPLPPHLLPISPTQVNVWRRQAVGKEAKETASFCLVPFPVTSTVACASHTLSYAFKIFHHHLKKSLVWEVKRLFNDSKRGQSSGFPLNAAPYEPERTLLSYWLTLKVSQ